MNININFKCFEQLWGFDWYESASGICAKLVTVIKQ